VVTPEYKVVGFRGDVGDRRRSRGSRRYHYLYYWRVMYTGASRGNISVYPQGAGFTFAGNCKGSSLMPFFDVPHRRTLLEKVLYASKEKTHNHPDHQAKVRVDVP
jgi:hypothetical protein